MGCYEQPAITAITPVMAAPITLSGDKSLPPPSPAAARRVGLAQQGIDAQPPHGAALALWLRRRLVADLLQAQADALLCERGVEEQRDAAATVDGLMPKQPCVLCLWGPLWASLPSLYVDFTRDATLWLHE